MYFCIHTYLSFLDTGNVYVFFFPVRFEGVDLNGLEYREYSRRRKEKEQNVIWGYNSHAQNHPSAANNTMSTASHRHKPSICQKEEGEERKSASTEKKEKNPQNPSTSPKSKQVTVSHNKAMAVHTADIPARLLKPAGNSQL